MIRFFRNILAGFGKGEEPPKSRDYSRWDMPIVPLNGIDAFLERKSFKSAIYAIELAPNRVLDIMVQRRHGPKALVFFCPAVTRETVPKPPVFYGGSIAAATDATLISISEFALGYDDTLEIGWHAGAYDVPLQAMMPRILNHLLKAMRLKQIVFTGISAGGYAAMYYAQKVEKDVFPIAINPQTQISKNRIRRVHHYAKSCWQWDGEEDIDAFLDARIEQRLMPFYQATPKPFLYVQNLLDAHVERQALPFSEALGVGAPPVSGMVGSGYMRYCDHWGEGHAPPPKEEFIAMVASAFETQLPWAEYVKTLGPKV